MRQLNIYLCSLIIALSAISCEKDEPNEPDNQENNNNSSNSGLSGCTSSDAINYNEEADKDDGSCLYPKMEQNTLAIYFTSTGCPSCGSWGTDTFKSIVKQYGDGVIPVAAHIKYGDPMINESSTRFNQIVKPSYTPFYSINFIQAMARGGGGVNVRRTRSNMFNLLDSLNARTSNAALDVNVNEMNGKIQINWGASIAEGFSSESNLYLAAYLMEDGFIAPQASRGDNYSHTYVLRSGLNEVLGKQLTGIDTQSDFYFSETIEGIEFNSIKYYAIVVLYEELNGEFSILNAYSSK